jgi:uncharacterized integral membrane protein
MEKVGTDCLPDHRLVWEKEFGCRKPVAGDFGPMTIPHKIQLVIGVVLVLLLSVFVLINHQSTEVNFIFGTFVVSRALLVLIFFGAGIVVGWLANSVMRRRRRRGKE